MMKKITIIGYGRFGQTLYKLLKDDFEVLIYTRKKIENKHVSSTQDIQKAYESETIFYAVPIQDFEEIIKSHKKYFRSDHLLIDVLSVKMHPLNVFDQNLSNLKTQAMLTHPIFGPDSSKFGFDELPIVLDKYRASKDNFNFWKSYFKKKKLKVVEMSAQEHDKLGANSLGLTHFIGRLLEEYKFKPTPIDPIGAIKFQEVEEQVCNDTWDLFSNLQHYNPYTKQMRVRIGQAYDKLYNKLLPKKINKNYLTIGIQGGIGSFNEEALHAYIKKHKISKYKIKYLLTTKNVLHALHTGEIDIGQFAIHNSVGGVVNESITAMAKYKFSIIEEFSIIISHTLMTKKNVKFSDITTIMSHPQVFAQCKSTLSKKYTNLQKESGKGELIDHAYVAKRLSEGKISHTTAVMGSKILAEIYDLKIIEENLQDLKENYTSFLMVER